MSIKQTLICFLSIFISVSLPAIAGEETLTYQQAVTIAISRDDPSVAHFKASAESLRASAIADAQLPDPMVKFGVANMAADSFSFNQEPMTQLQFGVHQSLPSSTKRRLMRERGEMNSEVLRLMAAKRELVIARETGRIWLQLKYLEIATEIVSEKKVRLIEMLDALGAIFESGRVDARKILTMEAELALLDDKLESLEQESLKARVQLSRFVGAEPADRELAGNYQDIPLPAVLASIEEALMDHPDLLQDRQSIKGFDASERLAKENYKPNFGVDVGYGYRAGGRANMATAMVTLDVPLFTGKRQDKRLFAAKKSKQAARLKMQAKELDMMRDVRSAYVVWQKSQKRIELYNRVVLERTKSARIASENAYASGSADFAEIIRTHMSELDARLNLEAIKLQRALSQIELQYYQGDRS